MPHFRDLLFASSACALALVIAVPAQAQDTQVGEVLVTARKRQESILNVPVVATAVSQEQLSLFQTQDLKDLSKMVPGLSLGGSILSVGAQVSLRGVGTSSLDPGTDQSVTLNIDGLALSQGLAYASGMFDVGQIEVLKGPQALFYGKSSPGGVISIRTADPGAEFEFIARAGYEFEARERRGEIIVSGPVSDTLGLRLAGQYGKQDGFYYNKSIGIAALGARTPNARVTPAEDYKLRLTAVWRPSDKFDARLKINRVHDDTDYAGTSQNAVCPDGRGPVNGRQFIDPNDCEIDRNVNVVAMDPAAFPLVPNNGTPFNRTGQTFGMLELNYKPADGLTLTSASGYYLARSKSLLNGGATSAGLGSIAVENRFQRRQLTQEVRLTSDYAGPFNFMVGGFLERGKFYDFVTIEGNKTLGLAAIVQQGGKTVDVDTNSVFGQVLYKIVPQVEVALGARWTDEQRAQVGINTITGVAVPTTPLVPKIKAKNVAPELTITYRPTEDMTLFGALKRGYKSGSFNISTPPFNGENNSFGDEKVEGGEMGLKARLFERRMFFNIATYYYRYKGLQVGANVQATNGITVQRTVNAGAARNYGIEADVTYRPASIEGLNLRGSINWNNGRYTELNNIPCYGGQTIAEGCNLLFNPMANGGVGGFTSQDRSGVALLRAPRWQANAGFDYEIPVGADWTVVVAANGQYSSRYVANLGYLYHQKSFFKGDLSLTARSPDERWEVALIGKNLNNALTTGNCANANRANGLLGGQFTGTTLRGVAGVDEVGCYMDRGREVWVRVSMRM